MEKVIDFTENLKKNKSPCPYCDCEKFDRKDDEYEFGPEFPCVEYDDLIYIRKNNRKKRYELVYESEHIDNSCIIYFCPLCGRELIF